MLLSDGLCWHPGVFGARNGYGVNKLIWGIRDGKTWGEDLISDLLEWTIVYLAVVEDVLG